MKTMLRNRINVRNFAGAATVFALLSAGVAPLVAQVTLPAPELSPEVQRRLPELQARAALLAAKLARQPKIECGMKVIPADPKVDPQAVKPAPDQAKTFTIRQVPPAACR
jgi:hypothetical protein